MLAKIINTQESLFIFSICGRDEHPSELSRAQGWWDTALCSNKWVLLCDSYQNLAQGIVTWFCCGRDVSVSSQMLSAEFQVTACSLQHQMPEIMKTLAKIWDCNRSYNKVRHWSPNDAIPWSYLSPRRTLNTNQAWAEHRNASAGIYSWMQLARSQTHPMGTD